MNKLKIAWTLPCAIFASSASANIIISEVVEGTGFHKAIEVANTGNETVSLNGYALQNLMNCKGDWGNEHSLDGIVLSPLSTYVVGHSGQSNNPNEADFLSRLDAQDNSLANFNGDDAIRLVKNGTVIDTVGFENTSGANCQDFNKDITLVRCNYQASPIWDESQWFTLPTNDWSSLGEVAETCEAPEPPEPPTGIPATVMELQGEGMWSPYTDPENHKYESDETFEVTGIITHVQTSKLGNDLLTGFFMQDQTGDHNPKTSDGIFVNANTNNLNVGDEVIATAKVHEHYGWTQLGSTTVPAFVETTGNTATINPTTIVALDSDENFEHTLERYEGMLVRVNNETDMHVARTFGFDYDSYRNNMVLSHQTVNYHPNQFNVPLTDAAKAQDASNAERRLYVESPVAASNGVVPWYPNFAQDNGTGTTDDYIRVGATFGDEGLTGVLGYSYSEYRLYVNNEANSDTFADNERPITPNLQEGELVVSSFNVENFFTSPFGGRDNPLEQNRGATNLEDYDVQLNKIVSSLIAIDADIYGLIEIENNGFDEASAIYALVEELNSRLDKKEQYEIAMPKKLEGEGYVGTDAITNKIIYRSNAAQLRDIHIIEMPQQHVQLEDGNFKRAYQRDAFTASFKVNHAKEDLVISTNHFKSKGSTCWEDEQTDDQKNDVNLQGSCEHFRVSAAYQLAKELEKIDGYKVLMGDLNSYGLEDPMLVLTNRDHAPADYKTYAARNTYVGGDETDGTPLHGDEGALIEHSYGYLDIVEEMKPHTYSYSYNDTVGTLDYILVDSDLKGYVVDAQVWPINAVESTLFEYSTQYSGDLPKYGDPYRSSDHDPAIVVFQFKKNDGDTDGDTDGDNGSQDGQGSSGGSFDFLLLMLILTGFFVKGRSKLN
ncbi:ExeM/NucH family extracellular endonuclease [Vibrio comitans]|uniref:Nuclease n=1 Tax=Vibrio comitans NBRC 102076 TaxID=1219078 RepID=A0A4Y3IQV0_9VIBR|nr:ExeM/NucH family extracellular endonuclease [Vibrio comitans]GEA61512.1 nuclease [Vibrio comitans NBRC 102076]